MNMARYLKYFLICVLIPVSGVAFAGFDLVEENYYRLAVASDAVLDVEIIDSVKDTRNAADYTLLKLEGRQISSAGAVEMEGHYFLRMPGFRQPDSFKTSRFIFFISGNGGKGDTRIGRIIVLNVKQDGTVEDDRGSPILGISKDGRPIYSRGFNRCTIDDAPPFHGPPELVRSFECPDGSQWWRGADRPDDYSDPSPLTATQFGDLISAHLQSLKLPIPKLSERNFEKSEE